MIKHVQKTPCGVSRAAEILGTTDAGVYMRVQRHQIPYRKCGKKLVFFEEELLEYLDTAPGVRLDEAIGARG
jgi:helix-turn-helix protein